MFESILIGLCTFIAFMLTKIALPIMNKQDYIAREVRGHKVKFEINYPKKYPEKILDFYKKDKELQKQLKFIWKRLYSLKYEQIHNFEGTHTSSFPLFSKMQIMATYLQIEKLQLIDETIRKYFGEYENLSEEMLWTKIEIEEKITKTRKLRELMLEVNIYYKKQNPFFDEVEEYIEKRGKEENLFITLTLFLLPFETVSVYNVESDVKERMKKIKAKLAKKS